MAQSHGMSKANVVKTSRPVKKPLTVMSLRCRRTHTRSTRGMSATASTIPSMKRASPNLIKFR
jgi:hypothetical protein